jgi:Protein of unknown function (DUF1254)
MLANPANRVNRFHHFSQFVAPDLKSAVSANVDTLLSAAWPGLFQRATRARRAEHARALLRHQFSDFYTNSFAYIGQRTTGTAE